MFLKLLLNFKGIIKILLNFRSIYFEIIPPMPLKVKPFLQILWSNMKNQSKHTSWAIVLKSSFLSKKNLVKSKMVSRNPRNSISKEELVLGLICKTISWNYRKSDSDDRGIAWPWQYGLFLGIHSSPRKILVTSLNWDIWVDLKIVRFLLVQQGGYIKHPCFFLFIGQPWQRRALNTKKHGQRETLQIGGENINHKLLVPRNKIIFLPLDIKLGQMNLYVKVLDKDEHCLRYLCVTFPGLREKKLKAGIFDGLKIYGIDDHHCEKSMQAFVDVVNKFLRNRKADHYMEIVNELLASFELYGCNMSIKIHVLFSHLGKLS